MFKFFKNGIIFCLLSFNLNCYSYEPVQTVVITKEDIANATPTKAPVELLDSDLHAIEIMEKRHFPRVYCELSDSERLKNMEFELLGRAWEYSSQEERIKRLKIASSNTMLLGTSLPPSISSKRNAKRMRNDSIQLRKRDSVGLLDGFLRLVNPQAYEQFRKHSDRRFEYEY